MEIYLSKHGGFGDGAAGCLAGSSLRLSGNDAHFGGKPIIAEPGQVLTVGEILARCYITKIRSQDDGQVLAENELVEIGEVVKAVLIDREAFLLFRPPASPGTRVALWKNCSKDELRCY